MSPSKEDDAIRKIYQEVLKEEMHLPELKQEKNAFIKEHFQPEPFMGWLRPVLTVPAFAVLAIGIALGYWQTFLTEPGTITQNQVAGVATPAMTKQAETLAQKRLKSTEPPVKVKRVSSHVGPVMVYHRKHEEVPITIVWVFPQGPIASGG